MILPQFLKIFEVYELFKYESSKSAIFKEQEDSLSASELAKLPRKKALRQIIESAYYELAVNMLSIANLLAIMIRELNSAQDHYFVVLWVSSQIIINVFFFLEMLAEWYAFGIA